ncbi:nitroreductase family protein [Phenylobacterium sp. LjRoot219]|uniref:nitroreductase family protein n=1 Tax=Phenylobacterium sp. LjRoot219 TaxID=3342283 RepID=UPI003ECCDF92
MTSEISAAVGARRSDHAIEPLFLERWSPRAFDGAAVGEPALAAILEAARWAPSASNAQPWRFIYAIRGEAEWERFVGLLKPNNAAWARNAGALVFICSDSEKPARGEAPPQPSRTHSFDAGAAWALMALQATALGFHAHAIAGFDHQRARGELQVPDHFKLEAAVAIGRGGDKTLLPAELQARETPSNRRPLAETVHRGRFR